MGSYRKQTRISHGWKPVLVRSVRSSAMLSMSSGLTTTMLITIRNLKFGDIYLSFVSILERVYGRLPHHNHNHFSPVIAHVCSCGTKLYPVSALQHHSHKYHQSSIGDDIYQQYRTRRWRKFQNRKPIGEIGCCESWMAERNH